MPEREADEALEARVERLQQLRLLVERQHARPRLVLPALDAAERVADVVAFVDRALEDRLQQAALATDRALRHEAPVLVPRIAGHLCPSQVQVADDVRLRDLVERPRAEVRQEVRDDLRVTIPCRLQRRVRLAVHGPPFSEARNRALPSVHARADVELDLVGASFGGLPVREPGGLAIQLTVDHLAADTRRRRASPKPYFTPFSSQRSSASRSNRMRRP